jgi:hypothetical protein
MGISMSGASSKITGDKYLSRLSMRISSQVFNFADFFAGLPLSKTHHLSKI